jgi:hypothetical protein
LNHLISFAIARLRRVGAIVGVGQDDSIVESHAPITWKLFAPISEKTENVAVRRAAFRCNVTAVEEAVFARLDRARSIWIQAWDFHLRFVVAHRENVLANVDRMAFFAAALLSLWASSVRVREISAPIFEIAIGTDARLSFDFVLAGSQIG